MNIAIFSNNIYVHINSFLRIYAQIETTYRYTKEKRRKIVYEMLTKI